VIRRAETLPQTLQDTNVYSTAKIKEFKDFFDGLRSIGPVEVDILLAIEQIQQSARHTY
jgi:hypothetical protein